MDEPSNEIIVEDCLTALSRLPAGAAQLIVTSPPYPKMRGNQQGRDGLASMATTPPSPNGARTSSQNGCPGTQHHVSASQRMVRRPPVADRAKDAQSGKAALHRHLYLAQTKTPSPLATSNITTSRPGSRFSSTLDLLTTWISSIPSAPRTIPKPKSNRKNGNRPRGNGRYAKGHSRLHPAGARQSNVIVASSSGEVRPRANGGSFPLAIPERFILQHTQPGDLVIDPFCGAGDDVCGGRSARTAVSRHRNQSGRG